MGNWCQVIKQFDKLSYSRTLLKFTEIYKLSCSKFVEHTGLGVVGI
jgi:hypothetical protein